ncbi:hypothetical protein, partial [Nocardioides sp.]|uniref:hypothetical protein n=1 Tax=Nocardioides sp. TaxID=35761 RepID=UPI00286DCD6E
PAEIKKAKRKLRLAKRELELQLEWYTTARAAYDKCVKANPTPTATPTSTATATSTATGTATPTGTPTTVPTVPGVPLPTLPPGCVPNPLPTGPAQICVPV